MVQMKTYDTSPLVNMPQFDGVFLLVSMSLTLIVPRGDVLIIQLIRNG